MSDHKTNNLTFVPAIKPENRDTLYPSSILVRAYLKPSDGKPAPTAEEVQKLQATFIRRAGHELSNMISGKPQLALCWSRSHQCHTIQSANILRVRHSSQFDFQYARATGQAEQLNALWQKYMNSERENALDAFFPNGPDHGVNAIAPARDAEGRRQAEQVKAYEVFMDEVKKQRPNTGQQFLLELNRCSGRDGVIDFLERNSSRAKKDKRPKLTFTEKQILHVLHNPPDYLQGALAKIIRN